MLLRLQPVFTCVFLALTASGFVCPSVASAQDSTDQAEGTSKVLFHWSADQEKAANVWEFRDPKGWKLEEVDEQPALHQFLKASDYQPPHRSPTHMALLKAPTFGSFQCDLELKSTHEDYGHRDVCLFFGYQDPAHFYYVHIAKEMDPRANQIFIVNQADRTKISETTTQGTDWDDQWHHVRICRNVETGRIRVYFDDMETPIMTATDKTFGKGRLGVGSFDDTAAFRKLTVRPLKD